MIKEKQDWVQPYGKCNSFQTSETTLQILLKFGIIIHLIVRQTYGSFLKLYKAILKNFPFFSIFFF